MTGNSSRPELHLGETIATVTATVTETVIETAIEIEEETVRKSEMKDDIVGHILALHVPHPLRPVKS